MDGLFLRVLAIFILILVGCSDSVKHMAKSSGQPDIESLLKTKLVEWGSAEFSLTAFCLTEDFYQQRHHSLAWFRNQEFSEQGKVILKTLHKVGYFGLEPSKYHVLEIDSLMETVSTLTQLIELDILLTDSYLSLGHHLHLGRVKKEDFTPLVLNEVASQEVLDVLKKALKENRVVEGLTSLEPPYKEYIALKSALTRKMDSLSGNLSDSSWKRLHHEVMRLAINMEQWRWESSQEDGIFVNIPSFTLAIKDQDSILFKSNVVVGTPETPTPVLDSDIKSFVMYPYWTVPRGIAINEILPKIKSDTNYLRNHHYRVLDISGKELNPDSIFWASCHANNFPFMLQQTEGAHNALGVIKFPFQSDRSIYLHDTNAKGAFKKDRRAYSHGCVRVERALDLAKFLAGRTNKYCNPEDIDKMLLAGKQQTMPVNPIDLHIRYYTCQVDEDGSVRFLEDVYHREAQLQSALYCQ